RFKKEDTDVDLDEVIALRRAARECIPPRRPGETINSSYDRFRRRDAIADLGGIVSLRRATLERTPPSDQCRQLLNLANSLVRRFEKLGSVTDVREAVDLGRTALELCPSGHPNHEMSHDCLANYLDAWIEKRSA
ncbi:hypothetical protein EDD16DRAFT_1468351, partial [Pisolithus croceorrhizus]